MSVCKVCTEQIDSNAVNEEFEDLLKQADLHGTQSLTEHEQMVFEGKICSGTCFEQLK